MVFGYVNGKKRSGHRLIKTQDFLFSFEQKKSHDFDSFTTFQCFLEIGLPMKL